MKKIIITILIFIGFINISVNANEELGVNSKSCYLLESSTGMELYSKNEHSRLPIASMTKMMTLTIIYDYIKSGNVEYSDILTTSENAKSMGGSQVYLETGETHTLSELIKCICISSANDAAVTIAEHLCGSEAMFVSKMNEKVQSLGLENTNFVDCTGLTDDNHYSSAYDMAHIGRNLINNYPEVLEITSIKEDYIREDTDNPFWLVNTNKLIGINGIDGLKTGWTNKAGYCITTTAKKNDMRLISVLMGYESPTLRNKESVELLNYGFVNYKYNLIYKKNEVLKEEENILYENNKIEYVCDRDINIIISGNEIIDVKITYSGNMGLIEIIKNNEVIETANIIPLESKRCNIFKLFLKLLKLML